MQKELKREVRHHEEQMCKAAQQHASAVAELQAERVALQKHVAVTEAECRCALQVSSNVTSQSIWLVGLLRQKARHSAVCPPCGNDGAHRTHM